MNPLNKYKNKTVLVTGHTGFKGAWLSLWLHELGAKTVGYSSVHWPNEQLFKRAQLGKYIIDERGDIRDFDRLNKVVHRHRPDMIFHLAAQPLVRDSYEKPVETFQTNILGTVNVLECIRMSRSVRAAVIVTTDKCYRNDGKPHAYQESDELGGYDPYSASKAAAEIVTESYRKSFFTNKKQYVASARAGNIIGGGDFSKDRLMPDILRSLEQKKVIRLRNPHSTRPWQHLLDPLYGYLLLGSKLLNRENRFADAWNFGPRQESVISVKQLTQITIKAWGEGRWEDVSDAKAPHESTLLSLDISKAKKVLGWKPKWDVHKAVAETVSWYKSSDSQSVYDLCAAQIKKYMAQR